MARPRALLAALLLAALAALRCVVWPEGTGPGAPEMAVTEALERQARGEAVLVDVRSAEAYGAGHIPGALSIPARDIEARAAEIRRMGRLPILYCG